MPSGAKKRKAAKKKKVHNSSTPQGENEGGELSSPALQDHHNNQDPSMEVKKEENSSETKSNIEIEIGSKSKSSNGSSSSSSTSGSSSDDEVEKKTVVLESAPIESLTQKVEDLEISPVVEPVIKPVDSLLEDVSQDCNEPKNEEKKDLVLEEKMVGVSENELKDESLTFGGVVDPVSKENGVGKLGYSESKDCVESSTSRKESIFEVNGANGANDNDAIAHTDRQPPVAASVPLAVQKTTSWKGCCGIFELFSGSER